MSERDATAESQQALCLSCGLCCSGVWFSHVPLEPGEVQGACDAGLVIEYIDDRPNSKQSCSLFSDGGCSGYRTWRPEACARYRCQLLNDVRDGAMPLDAAMTHVRSVRAMVDRIRAELPEASSGLLGRKFLLRIAGNQDEEQNPDVLPFAAASPSAQLDAVALNRYYERYFRGRAARAPGA